MSKKKRKQNKQEPTTGIKIIVCIPSFDDWDTDFAVSVASMFAHGIPKNIAVSMLCSRQTILVSSRQELADTALHNGATHLLWLDSDMKFPNDIIPRLLARDKPIVACNYSRRSNPPIPTAHGVDDIVWTFKNSTGLVPAQHVGLGVCLIKAEVFRAIERPYFATPWVPSMDKFLGEDVYLFAKARIAGYEILIDQDLSQEIIHVGKTEWSHATSEAYADEQIANGEYPKDYKNGK